MHLTERARLGVRLVWRSLQVVAVHRQLLAFPVASWVAFVASAGALAAVLAGEPFLPRLAGDPGLAYWLALADPVVAFLAGAVLTTFFNVALINNAIRYLRDERPRFRDGIYVALGSPGRVVFWGVVSSSVGLLFHAVERLDRTGRAVEALLGGPWSTAAFFVLPVVAFEDVRLTRLFDRARQLYRNSWGLTAGASLGIDLALGAAALPVVGVGAYARLAAPTPRAANLLTAATVVALLALVLVRQIAVGVSKAALYIHATTDRTPSTFADIDVSTVARRRRATPADS